MGIGFHRGDQPDLIWALSVDFGSYRYFTKWVEAIPTRLENENVVIQFLEMNILSHFSCPKKIIIDNAPAFKLKKMLAFCENYNITLGHSTAYYSQVNGLVESSNKILVSIIKKLLLENKKACPTR